ncbi:MAG: molybdate ABC transporter substrate-binding protein [Acidobacteriota bacterium]
MSGTASRPIRMIAVALASAWLATGVSATAQAPSVLIFAAASLQTAVDELTPAIARATGISVKASYAASSALAKQIENAAPADIFISADLAWMSYVAQRNLIRPETLVNLLGNDLVLVAPADSKVTLAIAPNFGLASALGAGRLAVADPAAVPAGRYAQEALTKLGVWDSVAQRLAPAENVRAALLLVSRGETPLGIVYRTDALVDKGVAIVGPFPDSSHAPIIYPAALTATSASGAERVLAFLRGPAARRVFERLGFRLLAH